MLLKRLKLIFSFLIASLILKFLFQFEKCVWVSSPENVQQSKNYTSME